MQLSRNGKVASMKMPTAVIQRSFSSVLETREIGEEARYIRTQEAQKQAEIRANIERILALEEGHSEKAELVQLLGSKSLKIEHYSRQTDCDIVAVQFLFHFTEKKEEDTGFIAKFGLNDWKFALPAGLFIAIPALSNEVRAACFETLISLHQYSCCVCYVCRALRYLFLSLSPRIPCVFIA